MAAAKTKTVDVPSSTTEALLGELREEYEHVASLIRRLEAHSSSAKERNQIFGELSAAMLHLHMHPAGLDEFLGDVD
jgi:hypothetical protein